MSESRTVTSPHSEYHSSLPSKLKNSTNNGDALKINSESINVNQGQTTEHEASNEENFDISQFWSANLIVCKKWNFKLSLKYSNVERKIIGNCNISP